MDQQFSNQPAGASSYSADQRFVLEQPQIRWALSAIFYGSITLLVIGVIAFATFRPILVLPRIRLAPGFSFQNQFNERSLHNDDLRGGLTLYTFTFSECLSDPTCPQNFETLSKLYHTYSTIEPGTPEATLPLNMVTVLLDKKVSEFPIEIRNEEVPENWHFVHGDDLQTRYVVGRGFQIFYAEKGEGDRETSYVNPKLILVDGLGMIRGEYRRGVPDPAILTRDVNLLQEEFLNRQGVNRIGYEAAHLFVCYP